MKNSLKRFVSWGLIAVLVIISSSGCGSSDEKKTNGGSSSDTESSTNETTKERQSSDEKEDEEIVYWNLAVEDPDKLITEYAVDNYNATSQSGYKVVSVPTQNDTYKEKLVIAMSSGKAPDVFVSWSGGPMNEYIEAGYAQPIDDLLDASDIKDQIMDAALAQGKYKGETYAIPFLNVSISGVFYNKEIFEKYNLEIPNTVSELENICDVLVANDIIPFALANASKWTGSMYFMNLATRYGGLEPFQEAVAGTGSFENESFVYAGEKIQEWVNKGYFPEGVNSLSEDDGQSRQLLYQEKAAMSLIGSWYTGTIKADSEEFYEKIDWFSFPAVDGSPADASIQIGTIGDGFISFNCEGEKLSAAFDMVTNYFTEDSISQMVDLGKIPPVKNVVGMIKDPVTKKILEAANGASSTQLWYDQFLPPAVAEVHKDTCQELFGLMMTPEEANEKLQAEMQKYIDAK